MCGFCGYTGRIDQELTGRMLKRIEHRGPDKLALWSCENSHVSLGHARLSILDVETGAQPMHSHDGRYVIAFNGEIYNHAKLRVDLEALGHTFHTSHSDTETILEGYRQYGNGIADKLNGMWAFVILDKETKSLFFSRDRFGKKPLFYSIVDSEIIFGSELSSVIEHTKVDREIDKLALAKYFAYGYVPSPMSLVQGVQKLDAGCNLSFDITSGNATISRYWRYQVGENIETETDSLKSSIVTNLANATSLRLKADVPVGVFLSGGIDSSSIISMAIDAKKSERIKSFSISFDDPSFDESSYSKDVADIYGTDHYEQRLRLEDGIRYIEEISSRLDEPIADSSLIPTYGVSKLASSHLKVILGGDGADELFAGYDTFKALRISSMYANLVPKLAHNVAKACVDYLPVSHSNMSLDFKLKRTLTGLSHQPELWHPVWLAPTNIETINKLLGCEYTTEEIYSEAIDSWEFCSSKNMYDKSMQYYVEQYLKNGILTKIDRASMLNGLEVRSPFLDLNFVNKVRNISATLKYKDNNTKYILKKALQPVLPLEVLNRKKKGFGVPIGQWFRDGALQIDQSQLNSICDVNLLNSLSNEHRQGKSDQRLLLWAMLMFQKWKVQWNI